MIQFVRSLFAKSGQGRRIARVPDGTRWYVIGDIHGRLDVFKALKDAIDEDDANRPAARTTIVLLGDLMDRGPDSAGVIELARTWGKEREVRYLAGNHEEMFLQSFEDCEVLRHFLKHGGRETVLSYGIDRKAYNKMKVSEVQEAMRKAVPKKHRKFLESFEDIIVTGDYVFAHAGIHPGRSVEEQKPSDLRWIRDRFLSHDEPFSHVIVHGHTIFEQVEDTQHRIGIDTGAFRTGRLTALVLEEDRRHTIAAFADENGTLAIERSE